MTAALMLQGTGSDVGKSLLVAGLCRAALRRGISVRPFKPQNMSNNAAVTPDGGEIGRAQALQARACGVPPSCDMNPVLLKPQTEVGAQVVLQGRMVGNAGARDYQRMKPSLLPSVLESFARLGREADLVLIEGAGSAAEVNLRAADIANMGFAEAADVPVVLVGDIDRGGVIAQIVGTVALLSPDERRRLGGFIVNKFRGDPTLFESGVDAVRQRTGLACLGVVPFFPEARRLPAEDAMALDGYGGGKGPIRIAVPALSRIANFDDLDPLRAEPDVTIETVPPGRALPGDAHLVILSGSKATLAEMHFFRQQGWDIDLQAHVRRGGYVLGLCAGYQMLGRTLSDPQGIEGPPGCVAGLGLLDVHTVLTNDKRLVEARGADRRSGLAIRGYEMHVGRTTGPAAECRPMITLEGGPDGAVSESGRVAGCYLHGIFSADGFRHHFLNGLLSRQSSGLDYEAEVDAVLDRLAVHLESSLDIERLLQIAGLAARGRRSS